MIARVAIAAAFGLSLVGLSGAGASAVQPQAVVFYSIVNVNSGKCLDVPASSGDDGVGLEQYTCNGGRNQQWEFGSSSGGFFTVVNLNSGKCADVREQSPDNNAVVNQFRCNGAPNQQWVARPVPGTGPEFQLVARHSDKCMIVANASTSDKAGIVQFTCGGTAAREQYWVIR